MNQSVNLTRDVEASVVPVGTKVTLLKGEEAYITQSLGGSHTVIVRGNMFRIDGKDADALGLEVAATPASTGSGSQTTPQLITASTNEGPFLASSVRTQFQSKRSHTP